LGINENERDAETRMQRGDNVLAGASLAFSLLAGLAGFILVYASARLMGYFEIPGAPREHESVGAAVVFILAICCFFEAVRFYRFFASPDIRDRYYATLLRRKETRVKS
jgi:hypothetical protein